MPFVGFCHGTENCFISRDRPARPGSALALGGTSGKDGVFMLKKFSWRIGALLVAAAALVALVGASIAPAASHKASAGTMRIWTDGDRKAAITKVANAWSVEERRQHPGRAEGVRRHPRASSTTVKAAGRAGRHHRRARLDGSARRQRPRDPARPEGGVAQGHPGLRAQGVHLREAVRHARRARERRPRSSTRSSRRCRRAGPTSRRRRSPSRRRAAAASASPSSRAPAATRTTCTRSSRVSCGYVFGSRRTAG